MPYSITTKDGITINNIPDEVAPDAPELKQRVAELRGGKPKAEPASDIPIPKNGYLMGLRDPLDAGAQMLRRMVPDSVGKAVDNVGNWLADKGLPVIKSEGVEGVDKIVTDVNKKYEQQRQQNGETGFDGGRLTGNIINPVNLVPVGAATKAKTAMDLVKVGTKAGAVSGALQPVVDPKNDFLEKKAIQTTVGAATGAVATPALSKVGEAIGKGVQKVINRGQPLLNEERVQIALNNLLKNQGMEPAEVSKAMKNSISAQITDAFSKKAKLDPAAIIRKAEFEAVGLADDAGPTVGQLTRDPMQFAKEKNLSGINLNGENQLASRFQLQNQKLAGVFDEAGANAATDRVTAGQSIIDALKKADEPVKQGVDDLYSKARSMTQGRAADLDRAAFSQAANAALDDSMANAFVPANVRTLLNDITAGKGPFNVESAVQIDSLLSKAQRQAERSGDDAAAFAVGKIRDALHETPFAQAEARMTNVADDVAAQAARTVDEGITDVPFKELRPKLEGPKGSAMAAAPQAQYSQVEFPIGATASAPVDDGLLARQAFDEARKAARSRFATIEDTPALKAAINDDAPDKFVQKYILGADVRDVQAMKKVLGNSPEALARARAQVADHLKRAAFGENASGDKGFAADRYLKTLEALGKQKLELFFSPEEVVKLKLAGKVASDINSIPVGAQYGTNKSGTAAAAVNVITGILDKVGAGMIGNFIKREAGNYGAQKAIKEALDTSIQQAPDELPAEIAKALRLLGTTGGAATAAGMTPVFNQ